MTERILFVTKRSQIALLPGLTTRYPGLRPVAGARSLLTLMQAQGIDCLSPDGIQDEAVQRLDLERIVTSVELVRAVLAVSEVQEGRKAFACLKLMMALATHLRMHAVASHFGAEAFLVKGAEIAPLASSFGAEQFPTHASAGQSPPPSLPVLPVLNSFSRPFTLDMRANNARTDPEKGMPAFFRLEMSRKTHAQTTLRNTQQALRSLYERGKAARLQLIAGAHAPDPGLAREIAELAFPISGSELDRQRIGEFVTSLLASVEANKQALEMFLDRFGKKLRLVVFDSPANPLEVALAEACRERGIETSEESHGCMVVHGDGARENAARIMAGAGYNWTPDIATIIPRSPLQTRGAPPDKQVIQVNRIRPPEPVIPAGRPFRILFAPNFLRWHACVPALTASCFDIHAIAAELAEAVAQRTDWALDIRVKTSTEDKPGAASMSVDRGLVPADVEPLYAFGNNIRNASRDSYAQSMAVADLVITEGVTAVMIEALEYRTPVLLMNRSAERVPSLPATRLEQLREGWRCAVYASSLEEDFPALIAEIARRHHGKPLLDDELSGLCWTDSPPGQPHYLNQLLAR